MPSPERQLTSWWRRWLSDLGGARPTVGTRGTATNERTTGPPPSGNGASSFHLAWRWDGPPPAVAEVAVDLTVVEPPSVPRLSFWAMQVTFRDRAGRRHGGGHAGLQHHPRYPGGRAVNWGGYGADGRELDGSDSPLPSALGNRNTRDLAWDVGRPYRIRIARGTTGWAAWVDDVWIRDLHAGGDRLTDVLVWSEVFADCDAPTSAVRWSGWEAVTLDGEVVRPVALETRYQSLGDGGCTNTSSDPDDTGGVVQRTSVPRATAPGARIDL